MTAGSSSIPAWLQPASLSDAQECEALTRLHARTFSMASRFLTAEKRRAAFAIYAFCRVADDLVDEAGAADVSKTRRALATHRARLAETLRGEPRTAIFRELHWAIRRFGIPGRPFHELINALYDDLEPGEFATWSDLARYCGGVASTVGEMCAYIFGLPERDPQRRHALRLARALGVALQLTNILRDIGEDAARGRCYLPTTDLERFGFTRGGVLARTIDPTDRRWQELIRYEIERARALYVEASPGLALVDADARCCATICARGYASILVAIERRGYDSLRGRARVGAATKARIMLGAWRETVRSTKRGDCVDTSVPPSPITLVRARRDGYPESIEA